MRVAKADVYKSLEIAANNIKLASRGDGRTSREDMQRALRGMEGTERALTDMFFRFVDHRDAAPGASVTDADLTAALEYGKAQLVAAYDVDNNGLSAEEIANMSTTGKLAVEYAKEFRSSAID